MFSLTNTGMNLRPLWTANVCPIMSGMIVERRDQVFVTLRSPDVFIASTFLRRCWSMKGPFLTERAMCSPRLLLPPHDDEAVGPLVVPGLVALGRHPPGRLRMVAFGSALTAAMRMVDRVHGDAADA